MLERQELLYIYGGTNWTSSFINALARGASLFLELGRSIGSAIRRVASGKTCSV